MNVSKELLENITIEGRYGHSYRDVMIKLKIPKYDWPELLEMFRDNNSDVAIAYREGYLAREEEVMDGLQRMVENEADGAGDAARALNRMGHNRVYQSLKRELFNL